jgi:hypothetical protein
LRCDAIEIATVLLEIFCVVCEIRPPLLQKRFGVAEREPENASDLIAAQRSAAVSLDGNGFEHSTREIAPCRPQDLGDVLREIDGNLHHSCGAV